MFNCFNNCRESKREAVLTEAQDRIATLNSTIFKEIAKELVGQDQYQYLRAFSAGIYVCE